VVNAELDSLSRSRPTQRQARGEDQPCGTRAGWP
jgi:hypothetical protein